MTSPWYMNINSETLLQAQDDLGMAYAAVQATVSDLEGQLQAGLKDWSGTAREAYYPVQAQWDQAVAHMATVLQRAQVHIGNAAEMYQTVEQQNISIWHG